MELKMANVTRLVPARSTELLIECQHLASGLLPEALKTVLDKVDDTFFDLANKADNSQRQNLYFDAMRELRLKRDSIERSFISNFNSEFENSIDLDKATKKAPMFAPVMELSLVDPDEVEESLALTNFTESVKIKCKEQLFGLDRRMGYLLSNPDLPNEGNPVGPLVIGNAFRDAFRLLDSDIEVKLTLFKIFDKFAAHSIHQMYCDINDHLIRRDVLPTISSAARSNVRGPAKTRVIIETEGEQLEATGQDVFSTLQSLMGGAANGGRSPMEPRVGFPGNSTGGFGQQNSYIGGSTNSGLPGLHGSGSFGPHGSGSAGPQGSSTNQNPGANGFGEVGARSPVGLSATGTEDLVNTLTLLQHGNVSGLQAYAAAGVDVGVDQAQIEAGNINVLRGLRETGAFVNVNQTDGLTFDIVSILFDYILDDPAIPDVMKALIGRLQIPMLKVALLDKALFSRKAHPARKLLDALAAAAIGWSETGHADDRLYEVMDRIVRRIVDEFQDDVSLFESALTDLEEYLVKDRDDTEKQVAESTRSLRTREQVVLAKMEVDDALKERVGDLEIRAFIRQFIFDYWRQLLIITHVEHGVQSEIWQDQLRTVDDLIWSIQDKATPQDRKALSERLPQLLKDIKRGMATLDMDRTVCSKFMSMMASVHVVSVKHSQETSLAEKHLLRDAGEEDDEPLNIDGETSTDFMKQGLVRLFERKGVDTEELTIDLSVFDDSPETESQPEKLSPEILTFVNQVTELDLGDWLEFDNDDGSTMRARFTWISPATGRYLFTTRQGQKALDTTLTRLADQFAKGTARRVDTKPDPIFDRAIGDLMDKLEASPTTH
jgi:hypothetical protein